MANALTDAQVYLNNELIATTPNSIVRKFGRSETTVRTQSLGNGNIETIHSVNQESAKSYFKFSLAVTADNIKKIDNAKQNIGANMIKYVTTERKEVYEELSIINDPEYPDSNDGVIEVEFEGKPLV